MLKFVRLYLIREKSKTQYIPSEIIRHGNVAILRMPNIKNTHSLRRIFIIEISTSLECLSPLAKYMLSHVKAISETFLEWVTRYAMKTSCFSTHPKHWFVLNSVHVRCSLLSQRFAPFLACDSFPFNLRKKDAKSVCGARTCSCTQHDANENTKEKNSICLLTILEAHNRRKWNRKFQH